MHRILPCASSFLNIRVWELPARGKVYKKIPLDKKELLSLLRSN